MSTEEKNRKLANERLKAARISKYGSCEDIYQDERHIDFQR